MWKCRNYSPEMMELRREVGECFVKFVKSWLENGGRVWGTGKSVF